MRKRKGVQRYESGDCGRLLKVIIVDKKIEELNILFQESELTLTAPVKVARGNKPTMGLCWRVETDHMRATDLVFGIGSRQLVFERPLIAVRANVESPVNSDKQLTCDVVAIEDDTATPEAPVVISEKLSRQLGLKNGDTIRITGMETVPTYEKHGLNLNHQTPYRR